MPKAFDHFPCPGCRAFDCCLGRVGHLSQKCQFKSKYVLRALKSFNMHVCAIRATITHHYIVTANRTVTSYPRAIQLLRWKSLTWNWYGSRSGFWFCCWFLTNCCCSCCSGRCTLNVSVNSERICCCTINDQFPVKQNTFIKKGNILNKHVSKQRQAHQLSPCNTAACFWKKKEILIYTRLQNRGY